MPDPLADQDIDTGTEDIAQPVKGCQGQRQRPLQRGLFRSGWLLSHDRHYDMRPGGPGAPFFPMQIKYMEA